MFHWHHARVNESSAVSALIAAAASLHAAWIVNLVWFRLERSGGTHALDLFVAAVYVIVYWFARLFSRGRDCSSLRDRAFHSFLAAVLIFVAMTLPIVYGFAV